MRLIDADKLPVVTEWCVDEAGFGASFHVVHEEDINKAPTIDLESLIQYHVDELSRTFHYRVVKDELEKQGEWVEWYPPTHMIMTGEELLYRCSACDAKYADVEGYRYCPYCGAKMGGTENNA